ncbi:MAG: TlyA family RNA methyltransferase [Clostridium butyricum]|nr:TlyA family RNA methyltransferase [Clostridium butyricum]
MAEKKERLDVLLVEKGIITSREKAKTCIMEGMVYVNGQKIEKAGEKVSVYADIEYRGDKLQYVSRGGLKLEKAMKIWPINLKNKVCMDIGASTGGFTDCMLQNGAAKVFSVDVGYEQFASKLREDERVICMERTNIKNVTPEDIGGEHLDFASIDVSFISLKKIMPATLELLKDNGEVVALIKPQFEAGREKIGKKGVVKEISTHKEVVFDIVDFLMEQDLNVLGIGYSPIKGPKGNREYLVYFTKDKNKESNFKREDVDTVVEASHVEI